MTMTRSSADRSSAWTSISAVPYSSSYAWPSVAPGSFPALRTGMKPRPARTATGAARMKPRASRPTIFVAPCRTHRSARASVRAVNATGSASSGVMSLNITPGFG